LEIFGLLYQARPQRHGDDGRDGDIIACPLDRRAPASAAVAKERTVNY